MPDSALVYVLWSMVPYSEPNLKLAFLPHMYFADLERISNKKKQTLKNAYYKAQKQGLIEMNSQNIPRLTEKGQKRIKPYKPEYLSKEAGLIVMFDIPEKERWKRDRLRTLLRELSFEQVQKSVWVSEFDHREYLKAEIKQIGLADFVAVYEARKLPL